MARRFATNPSDSVKPEAEQGRLIGYARVSTAEQSLSLQTDALERAGVHKDNLHVEKVSGVASRRTGLDAAMMDCRSGDTFVVWKLDRVARSLRDLLDKIERLEKRGVRFRSLTEAVDTKTAGGRLLVGVLGSLAQFERDLITERTKAGVTAAKARGVKFGAPRSLTDEQVREVKRMMKENRSVRSIAAQYGVTTMTIYKWAKRPAKR
jgi:DNA invertase Pin-like site-specific DNA recombinase